MPLSISVGAFIYLSTYLFIIYSIKDKALLKSGIVNAETVYFPFIYSFYILIKI